MLEDDFFLLAIVLSDLNGEMFYDFDTGTSLSLNI